MTQLEINVQKKLILLEEKEYVFKYYFDNLYMLSVLPEHTLKKLVALYHYDSNEINRLRKQWGYTRCDF